MCYNVSNVNICSGLGDVYMIPQKHQEFINKVVDILKQDDRIVGIALGGSYITGTMDEYSDLDFVIAVDPADLAVVMEERIRIVSQLGDVLSYFTGEHIGVPSLFVCLYDMPLLHVDFNFVTPEQKSRRIEDPIILYEKEGALSTVFKSTEPVENQSKIQWYEDHFWVWVHYISAKIGRGELFDALDSIDYLRENVLGPLIQTEKGIFPRGCRFIERDAPEYLPQLVDTVAAYNSNSCLESLKAAIDIYKNLRKPYEEKILRRLNAEKRALEYLDDIAKHSS